MRDEVDVRMLLPSRLSCIESARRWVRAHAEAAGVDDADICEVEVAMTEALSNVMLHSLQGREDAIVPLRLEIDERRLVLGIDDHGRPFEPERYRAPQLDEPQEGGYGVYLIGALMDEVRRMPLKEGGTHVLLVRYRDRRRSSDE